MWVMCLFLDTAEYNHLCILRLQKCENVLRCECFMSYWAFVRAQRWSPSVVTNEPCFYPHAAVSFRKKARLLFVHNKDCTAYSWLEETASFFVISKVKQPLQKLAGSGPCDLLCTVRTWREYRLHISCKTQNSRIPFEWGRETKDESLGVWRLKISGRWHAQQKEQDRELKRREFFQVFLCLLVQDQVTRCTVCGIFLGGIEEYWCPWMQIGYGAYFYNWLFFDSIELYYHLLLFKIYGIYSFNTKRPVSQR